MPDWGRAAPERASNRSYRHLCGDYHGDQVFANALRLRAGATLVQMQTATGLNVADLEPALTEAQTRDLMVKDAGVLRVTDLGWRFLSDVQTMFLR